MTATGASVNKHPAKEEIVDRLIHGESPESVSQWLKQKYNKTKRYHVSKMTLQAFRTNFLNLDGEVLQDIKRERRERIREERSRHALKVAQASDSYQLAKVEAAEQHLVGLNTMHRRIEELYLKVNERVAILESQKTSHHNDKVICEYLNLLRQTFKDYFEMERTLEADKQTTIEVDAQKIGAQLRALKNAVQEAIMEVCPEAFPTFMERFNERIEAANRVGEGGEGVVIDGGTNINIKL